MVHAFCIAVTWCAPLQDTGGKYIAREWMSTHVRQYHDLVLEDLGYLPEPLFVVVHDNRFTAQVHAGWVGRNAPPAPAA